MAHGSKMITRVLEEANNAAGMAQRLAPRISDAWTEIRPPADGAMQAPDMGAYVEAIAERVLLCGTVSRPPISSAATCAPGRSCKAKPCASPP